MVRAMSVLGDKILEISPGTPSQPSLEPNAVLPGQVELEFTGIAPSAESTMLNLNQTLLEIRNLVASIRRGDGTLGGLIAKDDIYVEMRQAIQNVDGITKDLADLLATIKHGDGTVGKLMASGELYDRLMIVTGRMNQLLVRFNQPDGTLARLATDDGALYRRLDTIAIHGEHIVARLDTGEGTLGKLLVDEKVYDRVDKVLSEMEFLIADIQENPTRYFKFSVF
jgi:phospholipid/cholesterol/gamma-HCH transport system substrate-binding protein